MKINLQLFNDGLIGDGVEDDNPAEKDEVNDIPETEDGDDTDLESLFADDEDDEDAQDEEPAEEAEEEPQEEPEKSDGDKPDERLFTQAELENIVSSRLRREKEKYEGLDSTVQAVRQLEKAAGMKVSDILEQVKGNRVQAYVDEGMDEDKAQRQVEQELHFEELQERVQRSESYIENMNKTIEYERQKNALVNTNPLYKKYADEIDNFAGYGTRGISFEDAAKYIIGDKLFRGNLADDIRKGAENRVLAGKRDKAKIESGSQAGGKAPKALSALEKRAAREFGISDKEWLDSKQQLSKKKRSR